LQSVKTLSYVHVDRIIQGNIAPVCRLRLLQELMSNRAMSVKQFSDQSTPSSPLLVSIPSHYTNLQTDDGDHFPVTLRVIEGTCQWIADVCITHRFPVIDTLHGGDELGDDVLTASEMQMENADETRDARSRRRRSQQVA